MNARALRRDRATVEEKAYPWIAAEIYPEGPRTCPCGHHEGWHSHRGACHYERECGCTGLPAECLTPIEAFRVNQWRQPRP